MAIVLIKPGATEIQMTTTVRATKLPAMLTEIPGGLYPMKSAAFEVDEYRMMAGWPVEVPDQDIQIHCLVSGEGFTLGNRMEPTASVTGAAMRWVADTTYYDQTTLRWRPHQGSVSPWETAPLSAPSLITDYDYRFGVERFVGMTTLNFDSDTSDYMWIDLDLSMGGTTGYTLIMVLNPTSVYGNDPAVPNKGLWGPWDLEGGYTYFTVKDQAIWMTTEVMPEQKGVTIGSSLVDNTPVYLGFVVGRPQTTMYAATGPTEVQVKSLVAGPSEVPLSARFRLGWAPDPELPTDPVPSTMDMALLDVGIYGNKLTREEVVTEFTLLGQVYGGDT